MYLGGWSNIARGGGDVAGMSMDFEMAMSKLVQKWPVGSNLGFAFAFGCGLITHQTRKIAR